LPAKLVRGVIPGFEQVCARWENDRINAERPVEGLAQYKIDHHFPTRSRPRAIEHL